LPAAAAAGALMPSPRSTMPRPLTATPRTLETTVLADRIKALTAWDAGAAMARTAKAADSDPPVIRLPLAA